MSEYSSERMARKATSQKIKLSIEGETVTLEEIALRLNRSRQVVWERLRYWREQPGRITWERLNQTKTKRYSNDQAT